MSMSPLDLLLLSVGLYAAGAILSLLLAGNDERQSASLAFWARSVASQGSPLLCQC